MGSEITRNGRLVVNLLLVELSRAVGVCAFEHLAQVLGLATDLRLDHHLGLLMALLRRVAKLRQL